MGKTWCNKYIVAGQTGYFLDYDLPGKRVLTEIFEMRLPFYVPLIK